LKKPKFNEQKKTQQSKNNQVKIWGGQIHAKRAFMFKKKTALLKNIMCLF